MKQQLPSIASEQLDPKNDLSRMPFAKLIAGGFYRLLDRSELVRGKLSRMDDVPGNNGVIMRSSGHNNRL
jgi:hypothetical protein